YPCSKPQYVTLAQELRAEIITRISKKHKMRVVGIDGGLAGTINLLGVDLQAVGPLSKEKIREALVDCVEEFITTINDCEELRPFFRDGVFDASNVNVAIQVIDANGCGVMHPNICMSSAICGHVIFRTEDKNTLYTGTY